MDKIEIVVLKKERMSRKVRIVFGFLFTVSCTLTILGYCGTLGMNPWIRWGLFVISVIFLMKAARKTRHEAFNIKYTDWAENMAIWKERIRRINTEMEIWKDRCSIMENYDYRIGRVIVINDISSRKHGPIFLPLSILESGEPVIDWEAIPDEVLFASMEDNIRDIEKMLAEALKQEHRRPVPPEGPDDLDRVIDVVF